MKHFSFLKYLYAAVAVISVLILSTSVAAAVFAEETEPGSNLNGPASETELTIYSASGQNSSKIRDNSYNTTVSYPADDTLTITSDETLYGLYIIWGAPSDAWTLSYDGKTVECGQNGFLHEYIEIPEGTDSCTITLSKSEVICDIRGFSAGTLPDDVQVWQPVCDTADIIAFSTHADDEILFLGGVLATYGGEQQLNVQVVYMTQYWNGLKIREHEKLDGLWASGIRNYPVNGTFDDLYAETLEGAERIYSYDEVLSFVTEQLRRFKPLVCVTQDLNGEYGHGGHMLLSKAVCEAVENSHDSTFMPDSAQDYGTWDVSKTYLHLYPENKLTLDLRMPLSKMGGMTALEAASAAYKKHVSQQWCWFYVSDDYEYSCADFGLYRTTVGPDTGNDMLENITTYEEQAQIAREKAEAESKAAAEAESASIAAQAASQAAAESDRKQQETNKNLLSVILLIAGAVIIVLGVIYFLVKRSRK